MEIKVFDKWSCEGIKVEDPGLVKYITLSPVYAPKTGARYAGKKFHKSGVNIVERLINKLMVPGHKSKKHFITSGHNTGKKNNAMRIVKDAFEIIEQKTKKNPVEVFVKAVENGAPREEIIAIEYGGARYPKAVECSPQRRIDVVLRLLIQGTYQKCFDSSRKAADVLAAEIIAAYNLSSTSVVISKKLETERQADSSR
ncbi:30S ribosomal protein S7 [Candidatus Woesearchaeota archaeon]|nr:30S ribosomal protein S7 [Candidatus Woesearchaeota archaeon]MBW3016748.1 30S ribosomal protein S7 [Candidatus Woesearchaeota archaeon]